MALKFAIARPDRDAKLVPGRGGIVPASGLFQAESLQARVGDAQGRSDLSDAITQDASSRTVARFLRLIGENFLP
jgi:hypothetical protein